MKRIVCFLMATLLIFGAIFPVGAATIIKVDPPQKPHVPEWSYSKQVPLSFSTQLVLQRECQKQQVPYPLAIALIEVMTKFNSSFKEDGRVGYMAVPENFISMFHAQCPTVTDVTKSTQNITAGVYLMSYCFNRYQRWDKALMAYLYGARFVELYAFPYGQYSTAETRLIKERAKVWTNILLAN